MFEIRSIFNIKIPGENICNDQKQEIIFHLLLNRPLLQI